MLEDNEGSSFIARPSSNLGSRNYRDTQKTSRKDGYVFLILAGVVTLLCTVFNLFLLQSEPNHWKQADKRTSIILKDLEFVDTYIGLDSAIYDAPPTIPNPISNYPLLVAQINSSNPEMVYLDTHRWMSRMGMIYPEDRRIIVTSEVSTLLQFRTLDFGMERCAFVMDVPPVTGSGEFMGSTHYKIVEIWHLESPQLLERVSWASKPRRTGLLGTVYVKAGESTGSPEFPCPANSLHTFEIACSSSMCHVEFQLDRKKPGQAIYLKQVSSLH